MATSALEERASYIHPNAFIAPLDQWVSFPGPGPEGEKLLEIPIGQVAPADIVVITVGLYAAWYNTPMHDIDPRVGISDHEGNYNVIMIRDVNDYDKWPPCMLYDGIVQENPLVSDGTQVSATYKLTFSPEHQYGECESPQDDGYRNIGTFVEKLDLTRPLSLSVYRGNQDETSFFRYFTIELMV